MLCVAPELRALVPQLRTVLDAGPLDAKVLALARQRVPAFLPAPKPAPAWSVRTVPGTPGSPDVRITLVNHKSPVGRPRPAILHMHGGGFLMGSAEHSLWSTQQVAEALDCLVVSVDYRLAPETAFPGALDDNYAALAWVRASADELGVDPDRIALMGESAGGGHAAMLALRARDRGEIPVRFQALVYPMLDDRTGSAVRKAAPLGTLLWDEQRNRFAWGSLLGVPAGSPDAPQGAVPARVEDVSGLPPTWIGVGSLDLFVDEDIDYARRLILAGVPTRLNVIPGAFHVFDAFQHLAMARAFRADLIASLRDALN